MKWKFACANFTFPLLPHEKVLRLIAMLEFDAVDIGLFEDRSHLWPSKVEAHVGSIISTPQFALRLLRVCPA